MSTFFKVQTGQNRRNEGVLAIDSRVGDVKSLISVKSIGFYIVSLVGKVIIKVPFNSQNYGAFLKLHISQRLPFQQHFRECHRKNILTYFQALCRTPLDQ